MHARPAGDLQGYFLHVLLRMGKKIRQLDFFRPGFAELQQRKLRPVAVKLYARFHFHKIIARDVMNHQLIFRPHPRFDGSAAVA